MEEVKGPIKRGIFKFISKQSFRYKNSILPCKCGLAIKREENADERYEARLVLALYLALGKLYTVRSSNTVHLSSTGFLLASSETHSLKLRLDQVKQV